MCLNLLTKSCKSWQNFFFVCLFSFWYSLWPISMCLNSWTKRLRVNMYLKYTLVLFYKYRCMQNPVIIAPQTCKLASLTIWCQSNHQHTFLHVYHNCNHDQYHCRNHHHLPVASAVGVPTDLHKLLHRRKSVSICMLTFCSFRQRFQVLLHGKKILHKSFFIGLQTALQNWISSVMYD